MLSRTEIRNNANNTVYCRGVEYNDRGRVKNITVTEEEADSYEPDVLIEGNIRGSGGKTYQTRLLLTAGGNEILDYECTCPYMYYGMCKHAVALALAYIDQEKQRAVIQPVQSARVHAAFTDSELSRVMEAFAGQKKNAQQSGEAPVKLECTFTGDNESMTLECRIGRKRMLIVKNLPHLVRCVEQGKIYQYGTTLAFRHSLSAFDEESQKILLALEQNMMDRFVGFRSTNYEYSNEHRTMDLYGAKLERMLTLFLGKDVEFNGKKTSVIDGNPPIQFQLEGEAGEARFSGPVTGIFECGERCFVHFKEHLWYCTPEFTARVIPLLEPFRYDRYGFYRREGKKLCLAQQDYTAFCGNVLPLLEGLAEIKVTGLNLSDWMPPEPLFTVYLHKAGEAAVGATASVGYGKDTRDLLSPVQKASDWHDPKEEEVRRCLMRYFPDNGDEKKESEPYFQAVAWTNAEEEQDTEPVKVSIRGKTTRYARGEDALWTLLDGGLAELASLADVYVDDAVRRMQVRPAPAVTIGVSLSAGLLDLDVQVERMDMAEISGILSSYRARRKYHRLRSGDFMELTDSGLSTLSELAEGLMLPETALKTGHAQLPAYRAMYVDGVLSASQNVRFNRSRDFKQMIREIRDFHNGEYTVPAQLNAELRPYQADGFQWLCALYDLKLGGILADDMGLGKTLQMIALFQHAADSDPDFSALVIAPTSLLYNWESEVRRFAPSLSVQIITGNAAEREALIPESKRFQVNITSYDLFKRDVARYDDLSFSCLVLDEAQYIKNAATKAAKSIEHMQAVHRFAMTGTPVENRLSDLWSIFNCLMPGYLYAYAAFRKEIEQPVAKMDDEVVKQRLGRMVSPFLLRRKKADVLKDLPDKLEENVYIRMNEEQAKLYQASRDKLLFSLEHSDDAEVKRNRMQILAALTRLRQLCCSPELCYEDYHGGSGKVDACMELLENAVSAGHRVLVFSQFTSMLELLIQKWNGTYLYLSGKDSKQRRREMVEQFQQGDVPVFFISLKAGGTGLNLTQADVVIHCDPWWNVAAQNQATDRAHRIGQKNTVSVMRLVALNTIEEKIMALQERKSALADAVVAGEGTDAFTLDREELLALFSERGHEAQP